MGSNERLIIATSLLLLISILVSKMGGRIGIPALLIFLGIGMLGGSQGPGGIEFHNIAITQTLAVVALCFILFSGGMGTDIKSIRPVVKTGLLLATLGVLVAAFLVGEFAILVLHFSRLSGFLLGATTASTDVAAVFTALRSKSLSLKGNLTPLLEFESAVNDPMTVFLCVGLLQVYSTGQSGSLLMLAPLFVKQMILGLVLGVLGARIAIFSINRIKLDYEGLYPALSVSLILLVYGLTQWAGGSGFLAVYIVGIFLGNTNLLHKKSLLQFHDGLTWLMQIAMFLTMGLLVLPADLPQIAIVGLFVSVFLIFVARPVSVYVCLRPFGYGNREIAMVSWAGLRGAVPIILATYPLTARIPESKTIFNLVFFVVLGSTLFQGTCISLVARWLKVNTPLKEKFKYPIEYNPTANLRNELVEVPVPPGSSVVGRRLLELDLPFGALVVLIHRNDDVIVPRGGTVIESGDTLLVLAEKQAMDLVCLRVNQ